MAILIENRQKNVDIDIQRLRQALSNILRHLGLEDSELSVLIVDDAGITKLNEQYLGRDGPTNVMAFPMREGGFTDINPHVLGDIVISGETAMRDATQADLPCEDEMDYLLIHGILHLLGYDHETSDAESETMKEKEREIFFEIKRYLID